MKYTRDMRSCTSSLCQSIALRSSEVPCPVPAFAEAAVPCIDALQQRAHAAL